MLRPPSSLFEPINYFYILAYRQRLLIHLIENMVTGQEVKTLPIGDLTHLFENMVTGQEVKTFPIGDGQ